STCPLAASSAAAAYASSLSSPPSSSKLYTLSLHDALPIYRRPTPLGTPFNVSPGFVMTFLVNVSGLAACSLSAFRKTSQGASRQDRKSTRLNSSHVAHSYAVFCLKKKN